MWARKPWCSRPSRTRIRIGVPCRWASGICARASVQDGDVIGGGVRPGPAFPQQPGQRLAGVVEEAEQRVVAEGLLPGRGRRLLLRVADHDRGVHVQHQTRDRLAGRGRPAAARRGSRPLRPRQLPRRGAGCTQPAQRRLVDDRTGPATRSDPTPPARTARPGRAAPPDPRSPRRRRRASPPDRPRPGPGHAHHAAAADRPAPRRHAAGQPGHLSHIGQQPGTGMPDHATPIGTHDDLRTRTGSLHSASAFRDGRSWAFDKPDHPRSEGTSSFLIMNHARP